ncbi:hypothetical protein JW826_00725 [Candidatus Woesearchaeota archaeon]|nr:hypothetical protein [Candidatus Woesearchaeota archaeon]
MDEREIDAKLKKGGVLAQVSFEVIGSPKEHVDKAIRDYLTNIKKDFQIHVLGEEFGEAEEVEGGLFSTFVDAEILVESLDKFNWLCVNFMPSNIDIIAPEELKFKDKDLTNWFNDLLAKLHEVSTGYRQLSTKEDVYVKSMNAMIHNAVLLAAEHYHDPTEISAKLGIDSENLKHFLETNVKKDKLEERDGKFYRKK